MKPFSLNNPIEATPEAAAPLNSVRSSTQPRLRTLPRSRFFQKEAKPAKTEKP